MNCVSSENSMFYVYYLLIVYSLMCLYIGICMCAFICPYVFTYRIFHNEKLCYSPQGNATYKLFFPSRVTLQLK